MSDRCPHCQSPLKPKDINVCSHCHGRLYPHIKEHSNFKSVLFKDRGLWGLFLTNVGVIAFALFEGWELALTMTIYAVQSLLIGIAMVIRILNLNEFSTSGFKINDRPVKSEPETKPKVATFFAIHFGMFNLFYLFFLTMMYDLPSFPWFGITICCLAFALQQWISLHDDIREDQNRKPNIGTLMTLPYGRIIPMHLMIIIGSFFAESFLGVLLFLVLKLVADILMYLLELYALYPKRQRKLPG